jgi:hypothetical protein
MQLHEFKEIQAIAQLGMTEVTSYSKDYPCFLMMSIKDRDCTDNCRTACEHLRLDYSSQNNKLRGQPEARIKNLNIKRMVYKNYTYDLRARSDEYIGNLECHFRVFNQNRGKIFDSISFIFEVQTNKHGTKLIRTRVNGEEKHIWHAKGTAKPIPPHLKNASKILLDLSRDFFSGNIVRSTYDAYVSDLLKFYELSSKSASA